MLYANIIVYNLPRIIYDPFLLYINKSINGRLTKPTYSSYTGTNGETYCYMRLSQAGHQRNIFVVLQFNSPIYISD